MDKVETILINAFQYERTQVQQPSNNKSPTWWPKIVREYDPKLWATSPDPDSYPVDGVHNPNLLGNKDVYDFVMDKVIPIMTPNELGIVFLYLGQGYKQSNIKVAKITKLHPNECKILYENTLFKIKNTLDPNKLYLYYHKV